MTGISDELALRILVVLTPILHLLVLVGLMEKAFWTLTWIGLIGMEQHSANWKPQGMLGARRGKGHGAMD